MASSSRLLLLRRGDHNSRLTEGFESLLDKEVMTDVSITCGQQIIKAHRTVLSIFSPFFKRVFDSVQNPIHYPFIVLKDMPYTDLIAIIDLMYRGEVTVTQDQFSSLKQSAKVLEVSELSDIISSYEEKNDIKPKLEDNNSSSARNTRKRGRPRRYCEDSDEDFKIEEAISSAPPTKRQLAAMKATTSSVKKTIVQNINPAAKTPTATRGGAHLSFSKQPNTRLPTATRGGHSAFSKPQTAVRGGHTASVSINKPQLATRGGIKAVMPTRGRPPRHSSQEMDEDFDPAQELRRTSGRRGRVGRPPRTASLTREDAGMPMASSLPVSLPEPLHVDLSNIFPNYNLNDVTSSTSTAPKPTVPVQFEQTIKQEPDSDSEVECIMSASSPLPSGVLDETPEIAVTSNNEVSTNAIPEPTIEPQIVAPQNQSEAQVSADNTPDLRDIPLECARNETDSNERDIETNVLPTDIVIKTEKPDSPVPEILETVEESQESVVSVSSVRSSENSQDVVSTAGPQVVTNSTPTEPTAVSVTTTSVSSNNNAKRDTNVPLLRFIKTERISPTPVVQTSFQPIEGQNNDESNSCEVSSVSIPIVPVLSRVKIERVSPNNVGNSQEVSVRTETNLTTEESSDVTSSHNQDLNVQIINVFSEHQSPPVTQSDSQQTANDTTECTSSSGQQSTDDSRQQSEVNNTDVNNEIDVQDIAFDCFYTNDDQQMQTYNAEVGTSSTSFPTTDVNAFLGFNNSSENTINHNNNNNQNNQFIENTTDFTQIIANNTNQISFSSTTATNSTVITSSDPTPQQFFVVNTNQQQMNSTSNNFSMDNNNVVMNSPIHSDEECMLLDSPQQSAAYEVTIGSEPNLDDSMDNL